MVSSDQIVGFRFKVVFTGLSDISFQSVSGLDVQVEKEALKEGGENRFEHQIPGRSKYTTLTLKRGILKPEDLGLTKWCQQAFQNLIFKPLTVVNVQLLNEKNLPLLQWQLAHVWPVSWKIGELNAERGEVLIETLELNYNYFKLTAPKQ
jgi:phage tail-like protein